ncbi:NADH-quinone oxidoreductase subunit C [Streptomyces lanatus]|uniref:NADH-quinone oxidoreductase subunit C n=1 Tax=Streptomyces lanatus TaxID=66900 RepID=A0ABV1Y1Y7_9ACTN|nr:NADH-quinone oxidoreductase subunit C [Streptomyces lanatus]GHH19862.1 dehydrogenase [Streptomyces lanatus]
MTTTGWLPAPVEDLFGPEATAEESYEVLTVDVPPTSWITALETARDQLGCTYFDWLSAVDEPGTGFRVAAHVAVLSPVRRLLVRTTVPHEAPTLPSAVGVYAGAAWHERETHEMFGVVFADHPSLDHLLLPDTFEGHPLRKDFVLAARVAKAWPGAKEPGESEHGGPKRRQMLPPGVPDPNEWGPLKGQLPPAPARPARGPARAAGERPARAAGERPVRRARTAAEGSASQAEAPADATVPRRARTAAEGSASQTAGPTGEPEGTAPRRARTAAEGSASQTATEATEPRSPAEGAEATGTGTPPARRARSASEGSASQRPATGTTPAAPRRSRSASEGSASQLPASDAAAPDESAPGTAASDVPTPKAPRSPDAPWHHARPAFDEPKPERDQPESGRDQPEPRRDQSESERGEPEARPGQLEPEHDESEPRHDESESRHGEPEPKRQPAPTPEPKPRPDSPPAQSPEPDDDSTDRTDPTGGPQ